MRAAGSTTADGVISFFTSRLPDGYLACAVAAETGIGLTGSRLYPYSEVNYGDER